MSDGDRVVVYADGAGQWRWHKLAANNEVIATSNEDFDSRYNAVRAATRANENVEVVIHYPEAEDAQ